MIILNQRDIECINNLFQLQLKHYIFEINGHDGPNSQKSTISPTLDF